MKSGPIFFRSKPSALALACSAEANRGCAGVGAGKSGMGLPQTFERTAICGQDSHQRADWPILAREASHNCSRRLGRATAALQWPANSTLWGKLLQSPALAVALPIDQQHC